MPRGKPRRIINFLLSENGHAWFGDLASEAGVSKSEVFRALVAVGHNHEPELKSLLKETERA